MNYTEFREHLKRAAEAQAEKKGLQPERFRALMEKRKEGTAPR